MYEAEKSTRLPETSAEDILSHLTARQHLQPHASVHSVLEQTTGQFGCCPMAIARALEWLKIDSTSAIGRLRRSELVQLARAVHRFWMQALGATSGTAR